MNERKVKKKSEKREVKGGRERKRKKFREH